MAETNMEPAPSLPFRLALFGREDEAKNVELAPTDALSPHVWDFLRKLKIERESFVLYDATRGRRLDPDWPCDQAGLQPGALVMVGDPTDFPDPLAVYRDVLTRVRTDKMWPISEEVGHELLDRRHELAVTKLEHSSMAREAGLPPDDAVVLWDWRPLEERRREEYGILLKAAKAKPAVPESAVKKLAELRAAMALTPEEHMDMCARSGVDPALAARLLEGGAMVPQSHVDYQAALAAAGQAQFSPESLQALRDLVVKHRITRDVHMKLAAQAGIAPDLADACFEDKEGLVGRPLYKRELLAANKRTRSTAAELSTLKSLREKYGIKRQEHLRIAKEWGLSDATALALWELKPPPKGVSSRLLLAAVLTVVVVGLASPPGRHAASMMWRGVVDSFQPASQFDADGFDAKGFDRNGYDRRGYDRHGFDRAGFDNQGFDKTGYNRNGYDRSGIDRKGRDKHGFDRDGYDVRGLDAKGFGKDGRDREGYDTAGLNKEGYDRAGFDRQGLDKQGFNRSGRDKDGFDKNGLDAGGYDRKGFNKAGVDRKGFNKEGFDPEGYDRDGFDTTGFNREGYDREGYDRSGYDKQGYDRGGYDRRGLDRMGNPRARGGRSPAPAGSGAAQSPGGGNFGPDGYGADGFDRFGRDRNGFDRAGYGKDGFNRAGRNRWNLDRNGLDPQGYDRDGYDASGYNRQGLDRRGFTRDGRDKDGMDREGYNRQGWDKEGRGRGGQDLLPGPLATLQGDSSSGWLLRGPDGKGYRQGSTMPPFNVRLERVGGNVVHFRHEGVLYERKIFK